MKRVATAIALACSLVRAADLPAQDIRHQILESRTHFTMPAFASREAWMERAASLRKQILASAGLLPLPERTPLNAEVFGKLDREGYSVEKVLLETLPGFYLGGNLYRPRDRRGPFPGVVSPHGHWRYGRLENSEQASVPGRCINLARQGFVVFSYDMIGYNDTNQVPHHWGGPREALWNIGPMGIQLWNSMRAVDFVTSLADVDPSRMACTGASGGGTQTFLLMAVDERIKAAAPVNMISASMQGGVCENAPNLRAGHRDFSNMVIGAMMAPRPLLLVSASGDWTKNTPAEEFPAIQSIYKLLGVEQNVESVHVDAPHNYNRLSREAVYKFFNARLLDRTDGVPERGFQVEQLGDLLALHARQRPANAVANLDQLVDNWIRDARRSTETLRPRDKASLAASREAFFERLTYSLLAFRPQQEAVLSQKTGTTPQGETIVIGRDGKSDRVPGVWLYTPKPGSNATPTLVVHPDGVAWVLASAQRKGGLVRTILENGAPVIGIDAFQTGAARVARDPSRRASINFNQTDDANRVQDILTALEYLRSRSKAQVVNLVGLGMAGVWSYFARPIAGDGVNLAADLAQFAADTDAEYTINFFVPGLRKAGDFRAASTLNSQGRVFLYNVGPQFPSDWTRDAARIAGNPAEVRAGGATESELSAWIMGSEPGGTSR